MAAASLSPTLIVLLVVLGIILLVVLWGFVTYNKLVNLRNRVRNAFAGIETQLQRRLDLIPNLVETVKGYAKHESETLTKVIQARSALQNATTPNEKVDANNMLTSTLRSLFAVAEQYPDLKADQNFRELQFELSNTEEKLSYARQSYNDMVLIYNNAVSQVPSNIIANMFGFKEESMFKADSGAQNAPKVSF